MIRVFILDYDNYRCCMNVTSDEEAQKLLDSGMEEVAQDKVAEIFGELASYACPLNTYVHEDGRIVFDAPVVDLMQQNFSLIRGKRDNLLQAYDKKISQLNRALYMAESEAGKEKIRTSIQAWHEYAQALCDLPSQPGAPWDGGGEGTPWPKEPVIEY